MSSKLKEAIKDENLGLELSDAVSLPTYTLKLGSTCPIMPSQLFVTVI